MRSFAATPDPMDTCIDLMAEEDGSISGIFHTAFKDDVRTVMKLPWGGRRQRRLR